MYIYCWIIGYECVFDKIVLIIIIKWVNFFLVMLYIRFFFFNCLLGNWFLNLMFYLIKLKIDFVEKMIKLMILMLFVVFYVYCIYIVYVNYIKVKYWLYFYVIYDFFIFRDVLSI